MEQKKSGGEPALERFGNVIYEILRTLLRLTTILAGIVLLSLWIAGVVICSVIAYQALTDFRETSIVEDQYSFESPTSDIIYISAFEPDEYSVARKYGTRSPRQ